MRGGLTVCAVGDGHVRRVTNAFTVLSVRLFGDVNLDGQVGAADRALQPGLSREHGWCMPAATNVLRPLRLRTDIGLSGGVYTLALAGTPGAFRVWPDASGTNAPLLECGQTVTNGVNGVSFLTGAGEGYSQSGTPAKGYTPNRYRGCSS